MSNLKDWGSFVIVSRTGLVVRTGQRGEVFGWLSDADFGIEDFDEAMEALNSDGWHHSFHETEEEALALAREGICCHGKYYYAPAAEVEDEDDEDSQPSP